MNTDQITMCWGCHKEGVSGKSPAVKDTKGEQFHSKGQRVSEREDRNMSKEGLIGFINRFIRADKIGVKDPKDFILEVMLPLGSLAKRKRRAGIKEKHDKFGPSHREVKIRMRNGGGNIQETMEFGTNTKMLTSIFSREPSVQWTYLKPIRVRIPLKYI